MKRCEQARYTITDRILLPRNAYSYIHIYQRVAQSLKTINFNPFRRSPLRPSTLSRQLHATSPCRRQPRCGLFHFHTRSSTASHQYYIYTIHAGSASAKPTFQVVCLTAQGALSPQRKPALPLPPGANAPLRHAPPRLKRVPPWAPSPHAARQARA